MDIRCSKVCSPVLAPTSLILRNPRAFTLLFAFHPFIWSLGFCLLCFLGGVRSLVLLSWGVLEFWSLASFALGRSSELDLPFWGGSEFAFLLLGWSSGVFFSAFGMEFWSFLFCYLGGVPEFAFLSSGLEFRSFFSAFGWSSGVCFLAFWWSVLEFAFFHHLHVPTHPSQELAPLRGDWDK